MNRLNWVVLLALTLIRCTFALAAGAQKPETLKAVQILQRIDPKAYVQDPLVEDPLEGLRKRLEQHYRRLLPGPIPVNPQRKEVFDGPDLAAMGELSRLNEGVGSLKVKIAQQIVSGPFSNGLPVLEDWPELPEIQKEMRTSQNLELAFWELPLDLVVANKGRVDTQVCNQMNFVMLWGIYAGYRRTFLSAPKDDSVRDQWARLLVTLDVGMDFQGALGRACRHSLRYARYLWGDTLTHRQFNWNFSSLSKTINILSDSMIWFENQKDPFVVSLRYNSSDGYVKLGSLSKAPPLGNWNRNRPQRSRR